MEYVPQAAYAPLVYDLNLKPEERVVYIKLKNAAAASMDITLINGNGDTAAPLAVTAGETDANNITTFAVQLPSDGYWKITSLKLKNVFYDGTFYTGQVDDPTTWLDLSQTVMEGIFTMTLLVDTGTSSHTFEEIRGALISRGEKESLSIHIQRADIFEAMHRV